MGRHRVESEDVEPNTQWWHVWTVVGFLLVLVVLAGSI